MSDLSHKQKAAWEYDRDQVVFKPYKWEGRNISPNLPPTLANDVLVRVAGLEAPHPKLSLNTFVCRFTCFIVIPFTLGWTFFFLALVLHAQSEERQQKSKLVLFGALILMLVTSCLLVCKKRMGYSKALKERETQLARLMDHITVTTLAPYRIKAVGGKCGAWVELQFEDPSTFMVMGGPGFGGAAQQYPHLGSAPSLAPNANPFGYHQAPQFA